jgi:pilus retraction protein PilT
MNEPSELQELLNLASEHGASDLFLHEGRVPALRLQGRVVTLEAEPVTSQLMHNLWKSCGAPEGKTDVDAAVSDATGRRYRANLLVQLGERAAVFRPIKTDVPDLTTLGLPAALLQSWVDRRSGLVLVCGPTGSGKSTTVAALLNWINTERERHLITVEDPVEYLFIPARSIITQREIGIDTPSFAEGLRRALRQSPDVIFVGEIRDRETAATALQASETGHVVISTLHVGRASEAISRLRLLFPPEERELATQILSHELAGVIAQSLIPTLAGGSAVAVEYFTNAGLVPQLLAEARTEELADLIAKPRTQDTHSLTQDLLHKFQNGLISKETALHYAPESAELLRAMRGLM